MSLSPHLPAYAGVDHCLAVPRGCQAVEADDVVGGEHRRKGEPHFQLPSLRKVQGEGEDSSERVCLPRLSVVQCMDVSGANGDHGKCTIGLHLRCTHDSAQLGSFQASPL